MPPPTRDALEPRPVHPSESESAWAWAWAEADPIPCADDGRAAADVEREVRGSSLPATPRPFYRPASERDRQPALSASVRLLSLAAGTLRDVTRLEAIEAAAAAGFGAVGLRLDVEPAEPAELKQLARRLDSEGCSVLDIEVVRLSPSWSEDLETRLVDQAAALGARHLLVVSDDPDRGRTVAGLQRVSRRCREAGLSAVLEFMAFTHPATLADAVEVAAEVGPDLGGLLVDALHLARTGGQPAELGGYAPVLFPYAQICDAPLQAPSDDVAALIDEARHQRLLPGQGELPLADLVNALPPGIPLSVEVQSDALERTTDARKRARLCHAAVSSRLG